VPSRRWPPALPRSSRPRLRPRPPPARSAATVAAVVACSAHRHVRKLLQSRCRADCSCASATSSSGMPGALLVQAAPEQRCDSGLVGPYALGWRLRAPELLQRCRSRGDCDYELLACTPEQCLADAQRGSEAAAERRAPIKAGVPDAHFDRENRRMEGVSIPCRSHGVPPGGKGRPLQRTGQLALGRLSHNRCLIRHHIKTAPAVLVSQRE